MSQSTRHLCFLAGLTGGIGSGKSTVARFFANAGWPTLDTDALAHQLLDAPHASLAQHLVETFGPAILTVTGAVDRAHLSQLVFASPVRKQRLEGLMHPAIERLMHQHLQQLASQGHGKCLVEIPLLVEAGWQDKVDFVIVVEAPEEAQVDRASRRLDISPDQVRARIQAQTSPQERRAVANFVVSNSGSVQDLEQSLVLCLAAAERAFTAWSSRHLWS